MAAQARIGVVLSSGGTRGVYAHTGFLSALDQLGIPIAAATGSSAGAVVGGIAASGADLRAWSNAIARVDVRSFWRPDPLPYLLWRLVVNRGRGYTGLSGAEAAVAFCRGQLAVQTFEGCRYPFYALAVSLGRGRKVVFSEGELAPRMVASAAMPILYRPVEIDGDWYCDGALADLSPMDAICCRHGLDALIVHHVSGRYEGRTDLVRIAQRRWSMLLILERLLFRRRPWYLSDERLAFHRCPCGCGALVVVLEPELPELTWPLNEGGPQVEKSAMRQAETLLGPFRDTLLSDPQRLAPQRSSAGPGGLEDPPDAPACGSGGTGTED